MATYDFTNSWDNGTYTKDDITYTFSQSDYSNVILAAQETYTGSGYLVPGGSGGDHSSDLQSSFGSAYGNGSVDLLNFVDFDYSNDGSSDWDGNE